MKILILINALVPGGAERQAVQDANLLRSSGYDVFIGFGLDGPLRQQLEDSVERVDFKTRSQVKAVPKVAGFIKRKDINLVMSHMFWANKVASAACFFTGRKNIAFEHGLGLWRKWHHRLLVRLAAKQADIIVTCSEAGRQLRINRDKVPAAKVKVIHNSFAVPVESMEAEAVEDLRQNGCFLIGFAGRFNKVKQLHLMVDAALHLIKETKTFRLILLGDGPEKKHIEKMVQENGLENHFVFPGYVTEPMAYLKQMDCFVLPSRREDFSLALLEASYCGLPCIAFDVGGNKEIIEDGITGWVVEPFNVAAMAQKILLLKENPLRLGKMKEASRQRVNQHFSQANRLEKLISLVKSQNSEPETSKA